MTQNWHKTCPTAFLERSHSDLGDGRKVATGPARPHSAFSERPHPVVITYTDQAGDAVPAGADSQGLRPTIASWRTLPSKMFPIDGAYRQGVDGETLDSNAEECRVELSVSNTCQHNQPQLPSCHTETGMGLHSAWRREL